MNAGGLILGALRGWKTFCGITLFCVAATLASRAQTLTTVVSFDNSNGGAPWAVVQGVDGKLYGTAWSGGTNGLGTVFVINTTGTLTTLHNFASADGWGPTELVLGANRSFYGLATFGSGATGGSLFTVTSKGRFTLLDTFSGLGASDNSLLLSTNGNFYGTTILGGSNGWGSVFKMTPTGTFSTLYNFDCFGLLACPNEAGPSGLAQGTDGNFYGTNTGGNSASDVGTIFKITPTGTLTTLYTFCTQGPPCSDGDWPTGLTQAADGNFYGTTIWGGISGSACQANSPGGCGTIFKITPTGTLTTLYTFCTQGPPCSDGGLPSPWSPLIQGTDGNFYGTTFTGSACFPLGPCGTIFRMTPSGALTTLHVFNYADGSDPRRLMQATDGNLYGTAEGGAYDAGTIFRLSTGLRPFVKFVQSAGRVGQTIGIIGQGFKGTTSVSFNGTAATFTIVSGNLITVAVPTGATTGFVTVQKPSGTVKSNVVFHVL